MKVILPTRGGVVVLPHAKQGPVAANFRIIAEDRRATVTQLTWFHEIMARKIKAACKST